MLRPEGWWHVPEGEDDDFDVGGGRVIRHFLASCYHDDVMLVVAVP